MKKITTFLLFFFITSLLFSFKKIKYPSQPPTGHTGATGQYCTSCHGGTPLNNTGGSVTVNGLPSSTLKPDSIYNFSLKIMHGTNDRGRWGFSIIALNDSGNPIGTFNTTNNHAIVNGDELSHYYAVTTNTTNTYTYNDLSWKAPSTPQNVKFYYVGMASNNSSGTDDDYVYANSLNIALSVKIVTFTIEEVNGFPLLKWTTSQAINCRNFEVERSEDGQFYFPLNKISVINSALPQSYTYLDARLTNSNSTIFYRLKTVDKDGKVAYSKQIFFKPNLKNSFIIHQPYPSLLKAGERISLNIINQNRSSINLQLIDANGKIHKKQTNLLNKGNNILYFDSPNNLSRGIYFLQCQNQLVVKTFGIIIK